MAQVASLVVFLGLIGVVGQQLHGATPAAMTHEAAASDRAVNDECTPPDFAVKMGHAEMWKLHHNCK